MYSKFQIHFHINYPNFFQVDAFSIDKSSQGWKLIIKSWHRFCFSSVIGWWKIRMFSSNYGTKRFHCFIKSDVFCWHYSLQWHNKSSPGFRQPNIYCYAKGSWSLGQRDPLEEEITTHSSILAWKILDRSLGASPKGLKEPDTTEQTQARMALCL